MNITKRNALATVTVVAMCALLAACAPAREDTVPMPVPSPTISASASATPVAESDPDPTMLPGGTALANRAYFDFVNKKLLSVNKNPSDEAVIHNLVSAGFDKADMEITSDKTSQLRRPSDSLEFSVRVGESCLIGQFESNGYRSIIGPVLSGGRCLIGRTEPIT